MKLNNYAGYLVSLVATIFLLTGSVVEAQNVYCVRAGATGANNGSDWLNAYSTLPATLQRGATYYVAAGTYVGYSFDDAPSGTQVITIKKATTSEHGTSTGWQSAYGDGVAIFTGTLTFWTRYWVLDGQVGGGPGSWTSGHGFEVRVTAVDSGKGVDIQNGSGNVTVRHLKVLGNGGEGPNIAGGNTPFVWRDTTSQILISYCYTEQSGDGPFGGGGSDVVVEYTYTGVYESYPVEHAEIAIHYKGFPPGNPPVENIVYRWCVFAWITGTGGLMIDGQNIDVYGCVFYRPPGGPAEETANGILGTFSARRIQNARYYNNSFIDYQRRPVVGTLGVDPQNLDFRNNIVYSTDTGNIQYINHNYNTYFSSAQLPPLNTGEAAYSGYNPFTDYLNLDFSLKTNSAPADTSVPIQYRTDMFGRTGSTRGAVQFQVGSADVTAPTVGLASLSAGSVVSNTVTLGASASDDAGGTGVASVTFLVDGVAVGSDSSTPYSLNWDSRTVSNGSHVIQARAVDGAGNLATSSSVAVTVQNILDTTPPSVNLTTPLVGMAVSNTVTLSADASDNPGGSGVVNVIFLVDGAAVGSDSSSPYSVSWYSRNVTNGSHVIQARAVDQAGNQATSSPRTVAVQNAALTLADGLIGYWKLDEGTGDTVGDFSGNGNNATVFNGPAWVAGRLAGGLSFDGIDDYVSVPTSSSLETTVNGVSVCAWVKIESNGQWQAIARKVLQEGSHEFPYSAYDLMVEDAGSLLPRMAVSRDDGSRELVYGSTALSYGQWYHLAGVYDGTEVRIYVNGTQEGSTPFTGTLVQTGQPLLIGRNGVGGDLLKGVVDDFRVYNRALTGVEIQMLGDQSLSPPQVPPSNLRVASN